MRNWNTTVERGGYVSEIHPGILDEEANSSFFSWATQPKKSLKHIDFGDEDRAISYEL